jgi:hypothetical protein
MDISNLWVYRVIPIDNLKDDLSNGLYSRKAAPKSKTRVAIGHSEIIDERDNRIVKCYPDTVVNDYVPFYFSVRTPMLYNIITGFGVPAKPQKEIIYLCCKYTDLANDEFQWCFTDGNAAKKISRYYTNNADLEKLDWKSIKTEDFRSDNSDSDEDRLRKKHSEFLVLNQVPVNKIGAIVVLNSNVKDHVNSIVESCELDLNVYINPKKRFYFI